MDKQTGDFPGSSLKLGDFFLWRGLTPDETKAILEHLDRPETFEKGARIFSGVHFRRALAMILSGEVQVFRSDGDGRRVVMNRLSAGQVFGAAALFGDTEAYATEIEALCPTSWCLSPRLKCLPASRVIPWSRKITFAFCPAASAF